MVEIQQFRQKQRLYKASVFFQISALLVATFESLNYTKTTTVATTNHSLTIFLPHCLDVHEQFAIDYDQHDKAHQIVSHQHHAIHEYNAISRVMVHGTALRGEGGG